MSLENRETNESKNFIKATVGIIWVLFNVYFI